VVDERIPYWADLWPSAIALSRYLIREALVAPGMDVLEIGCGLALPGIVAGRLSGRVTLSDYLEEALLLARHNWKQNLEAKAVFRRMDWRNPDPALAADLVLASDVAYELRAFEPLVGAFQALCRPGGSIVVSEPNRAIARSFLDELQLEGFAKQHAFVTGRYDGLDYGVHIYHFRTQSST
jgi:predicted nicotinamide N-methyase